MEGLGFRVSDCGCEGLQNVSCNEESRQNGALRGFSVLCEVHDGLGLRLLGESP